MGGVAPFGVAGDNIQVEGNDVRHVLHKHLSAVFLALVLVAGFSGTVVGFGHYTPGALGINAASLPPQGFHYTMYNIFYNADKKVDGGGHDLGIGLDLSVYALASQFTYMTDLKILGASYGFDAVVPLIATDVTIGAAGLSDDRFDVGDICIEPFLLSWHTPRMDLTLGLGFYAPTADNDNLASAGKGYWSFMETLGATCYFDDAKTMSASVLTRWLQNGENDDTHITPGADVVAEYGISKTIPLSPTAVFTGGLAGYTYAQISDDSGKGASDDRFSGSAIGPEVRCMVFKPFPIQLSARYLFEYGVENSTEGSNACVTFIGSF